MEALGPTTISYSTETLALVLPPSHFNNWFSQASKLFVTTVKWFLKCPAGCSSFFTLRHQNKACIHIQSHVVLLWQQKWLTFALACRVARSEETRECLLWACNYCFCLLLRPPQTRKSPNYRKEQRSLKLETSPERPVINAFHDINLLSYKIKSVWFLMLNYSRFYQLRSSKWIWLKTRIMLITVTERQMWVDI